MIGALLLAAAIAQDARPGERILFLGDSMTDQGGFLPLVAERLGGAEVINRGLNGAIAGDILAGREQWGDAQASLGEILETDRPTVCVILLGINDLLQARAPGLEGYAADLRRVVDACQSAGARVVVGTPALAGELPPGENPHDAAIAAYAAAAQRVAAASGAHFADVRGAMLARLAQSDGARAPAGRLTYDGIHLLPAGDALLAEVLAEAVRATLAPTLVPAPARWQREEGWLILPASARIRCAAAALRPQAEALATGLACLLGAPPQVLVGAVPEAGEIALELDPALPEEGFELDTRDAQIRLRGGDARGAAWAAGALLQLAERTPAGLIVPRVRVEDAPAMAWRGLLVDVARQFHPLPQLREVVDLCAAYRMRWLVLHLADDQSFTFASELYPRLATPGRCYTQTELRALAGYAEARGVTLIPELEFPGHSTALRRAMPELFDALDPTTGQMLDLGVVNLGKPEVYAAYDALIGEIAAVFHSSPFFHVGGDEAWLGRIALAPETAPALRDLGSADPQALFIEGLRRIHAIVRARGLTTLMWESFRAGPGLAPLARDGLVMIAWETMYETPQNLLAAGYSLINASWKPLYVTPGPRFTDAETLRWNPWRWDHFVPHAPSYAGMQLEPTPQILGGLFCSWEMAPEMELPALRPRLPLVAERLWTRARQPDDDLLRRRAAADRAFAAARSPLRVVAAERLGADAGVQPGREDWHRGELRARVWSAVPGVEARVSMSEGPHGLTLLEAQGRAADGTPLGASLRREFACHPVLARIEGALPPAGPRNAWDEGVEFAQQARVFLEAPRADWSVRWSFDDGVAQPVAAAEPVLITAEGVLLASCFDAQGAVVGAPLRLEFRRVRFEPSLATGKPVRASDHLPQFPPENAVDGRVELERYWDSSSGAPQWLEVDLEEVRALGGVRLWTYWDGARFYQYRVEVSADGVSWTRVVDAAANTAPATAAGYAHRFAPVDARYVRVTMLRNSANPGLHVVELAVDAAP